MYDVYGDCVGDDHVSSDGSVRHGKVPRKQGIAKLKGPDACIDSRAASGYLNNDEVAAALHVQRPSFEWGVCTTVPGWSYNSTRPNLPRDTYPALVRRYRVLVSDSNSINAMHAHVLIFFSADLQR
jgi:hypothetical protein